MADAETFRRDNAVDPIEVLDEALCRADPLEREAWQVVRAALAERDAEIERLRAIEQRAREVVDLDAAGDCDLICATPFDRAFDQLKYALAAAPAPAEGPAVLNRSELFAAILVGIAGESDPAPTTEQCERAVEMILRMAARKAAPPRAREQTDPTDEETDHE